MNGEAEQLTDRRLPRSRHLPERIWPILVLCLCGLAVWLLPAFHLQELNLPEDLRSISQHELRLVCDMEPGRHLLTELGGSLPLLLSLRYGAVEDRIRNRFPAIKDVAVFLDFPGAVTCTVTERVEVAWLAIPDGCVMIDKDGVALKITADPPSGIPVIEGISVRSMILGLPLEVDVAEAMHRAISLLGAIIEADRDQRPETALLAQVTRIRPISGRQLYLTLIIPGTGEEMTVLNETRTDLAEDMLWLRFALDQGVLSGRGKGILDMTGSRRTFIPDP
jgi:hypothetical protein